MIRLGMMLAAVLLMPTAGNPVRAAKMTMETFPISAGAGAHDVYPAPDGTVWFTAQSAGKLGRLDPRTGKSDFVALGPGAAPPWGHSRTRRCCLGHRRWAECNRTGRSRHPRGETLPA